MTIIGLDDADCDQRHALRDKIRAAARSRRLHGFFFAEQIQTICPLREDRKLARYQILIEYKLIEELEAARAIQPIALQRVPSAK
jgi:hypothetical protein